MSAAAAPCSVGTAGGDIIDARIPATEDIAHLSRLAVVGELTAAIAHELRQPLAAILANAEAGAMLAERLRAGAALRAVLSDLRRDAVRAGALLEQVRTMATRPAPVPGRLEANAFAAQTAGLLDAECKRRSMRIVVAPTDAPVFVQADRGQLERVVVNLLLNALDATEAIDAAESPPILLAVARADVGAVELSVRDAGRGIPDAQLPRLFHSFHTTKPHGLGLGLSIARSIVEAHGGWIRAANNAQGGATFRVILPSCGPGR